MASANFEPSVDGGATVDHLFQKRPQDRPVLKTLTPKPYSYKP